MKFSPSGKFRGAGGTGFYETAQPYCILNATDVGGLLVYDLKCRSGEVDDATRPRCRSGWLPSKPALILANMELSGQKKLFG